MTNTPPRHHRLKHLTRLLAAALLAVAANGWMPVPPAAAQSVTVGKSGLPVPRFVSLKAGRVNVRVGPGQDYRVAWIYTRPGLPLEVIQEFDNWRRVRDAEGDVGWVFHSLLSSRRSGVVAPWGESEPVPLRRRPDAAAPVAAYLGTGVLGAVEACSEGWCRLEGRDYRGWISQEKLWGVYPDEVVD